MRWKIDRCYLEDEPTCIGSQNWRKDPQAATMRFRLLDDDGEIYFGGRCTPDTEFEPLDNYGVAFGCTEIQFKEDGEWKTL